MCPIKILRMSIYVLEMISLLRCGSTWYFDWRSSTLLLRIHVWKSDPVQLKPVLRVARNYCVPCQQCCSLKLIICSCLNKLFAYLTSFISLLNTYICIVTFKTCKYQNKIKRWPTSIAKKVSREEIKLIRISIEITMWRFGFF